MMMSKEAIKTLNKIADKLLWSGALDIADEIEKCVKSINKDLDILDDFIKLFEGEDLEGWIEFDFSYTRESETSIYNHNGLVSLLKRIRNYLEGLKNE